MTGNRTVEPLTAIAPLRARMMMQRISWKIRSASFQVHVLFGDVYLGGIGIGIGIGVGVGIGIGSIFNIEDAVVSTLDIDNAVGDLDSPEFSVDAVRY